MSRPAVPAPAPPRLSLGLALLLDDRAGTADGTLHRVALMRKMAVLEPDAALGAHLQRTLAHVLDAHELEHSAAASPLVEGAAVNYRHVRAYLADRLGRLPVPADDPEGQWPDDAVAAGRLGPAVAQMEEESSSGGIKFDVAGLLLESQSNFSSARANVCMYKARWMYEVTLFTAGIQQLGWATLRCPFTNEDGVGDAADSYAYDGKRLFKWGGGCQEYGQPWVAGDVIGCCLDLEQREISFYRNGVPLGVAFTGVRSLEPGLGYFPAVSLSYGERCLLNFGSRPMQHPVPGFLPVQAPPSLDDRPLDSLENVLATAQVTAKADQAFKEWQSLFEKQTEKQSQEESQVELGSWLRDLDVLPSAAMEAPGGTQQFAAMPAPSDASSRPGPALQASYLLACLQRLVQLDSKEAAAALTPQDRLRRPSPLPEDDRVLLAACLAELLGPLLTLGWSTEQELDLKEQKGDTVPSRGAYVIWAALVPFLLRAFRQSPPHDTESLEEVLDLLLACLDEYVLKGVIPVVMDALAYGCTTSSFCPPGGDLARGPYPYLAVANKLISRWHWMAFWLHSRSFQATLEGLLFRKGSTKLDLEVLLPAVWWPGCTEGGSDTCTESQLKQITSTLAAAVAQVEDLQVELCKQLLHFDAPLCVAGADQASSKGLVLCLFLQNLTMKNLGANRNIPPPGLADQSVLVSAYFVMLRMLSFGLAQGDHGKKLPGLLAKGSVQAKSDVVAQEKTSDCGSDPPQHQSEAADPLCDRCHMQSSQKPAEEGTGGGFLHRGGKRRFQTKPFIRSSAPYATLPRLGGTFSHLLKAHPVHCGPDEAVEWDEDEDAQSDGPQGAEEPSSSNRWWHDAGEASTSGRPACDHYRPGAAERQSSPAVPDDDFCEEGLADTMILLYHLGLASSLKQAALHLQGQVQAAAQLADVERQISPSSSQSSDRARHLAVAREVYGADVLEHVRRCVWYRVTCFATWKQEAMYATCIWIVKLLMALSKSGDVFAYVPEYYLETMVDSFHALRRSDPPLAPASFLLRQGLSSLVTFLVTHVIDSRIINPDIRDMLLQSISVLLQYKEYVAAFEVNPAARKHMVPALLTAFDNRFWIPVSNILLRLCNGQGFGNSGSSDAQLETGSAYSECSSSVFQALLRDNCRENEKLFLAFLNQLFNTLNWTVTEFSAAIKEMQDTLNRRQPVQDLQQRKCSIMFELSCNLERILEFFALQVPEVFLEGPEINLQRLCEFIMFTLNHTTSDADARLFDSMLKCRLRSAEKVTKWQILAPIVGIVATLGGQSTYSSSEGLQKHNIAKQLALIDASPAAVENFEHLVAKNWAHVFRGDHSLSRLPQLKNFVRHFREEVEAARSAETRRANLRVSVEKHPLGTKLGANPSVEDDEESSLCAICYASEADTFLMPCSHLSCRRCISRHLLNSRKCFFCNATIAELVTPRSGAVKVLTPRA
eukprot:SM000012S25447  [mRNA]  locus=s12:1115664:1123627:- [translate_table: standard]